MVRSVASRTTSGSLGSATTWSSTIATSLPRRSWMATARSGESSTSRPSMCERKTACCSLILRHFGQAEELKAAAIGQDRAVPAHEAVQSAQRGDHFFARAAAPGDRCCPATICAPVGTELIDLQPLDGPCVPTGMKAGISTVPCGVWNLLRRAAVPASR